MKPLALPPNPVHRFYRGGARIAALRGLRSPGDYFPEDWVGSVTATHGSAEEGVSRLDSGESLADLVARDPDELLGPDRSGPGLLVKLLDAGERLPVHFHPDGRFAREHLGAPCGKTEAWFVISAEGADACVWLGLSQPVDEHLAGWVEHQDTEALLAALNRVPVQAGDALFVPAGLLHAIGEGVLICELQEPSDLSVLLEWRGFDLEGGDPCLGLGLPAALSAVRHDALSANDLQRLRGDRGHASAGVERLLPSEADAFFRAERLRPSAGSLPLPQELSVLVVLDGEGRLVTDEGQLELRRGHTALIPWGARDGVLEGDLDVLRCMPPQSRA